MPASTRDSSRSSASRSGVSSRAAAAAVLKSTPSDQTAVRNIRACSAVSWR